MTQSLTECLTTISFKNKYLLLNLFERGNVEPCVIVEVLYGSMPDPYPDPYPDQIHVRIRSVQIHIRSVQLPFWAYPDPVSPAYEFWNEHQHPGSDVAVKYMSIAR